MNPPLTNPPRHQSLLDTMATKEGRVWWCGSHTDSVLTCLNRLYIKMDFCDCSSAAWPHKSTHVNTWNKMRMHCSPPSGTHCVHTVGVREAIFVAGDIVVQLAADVSRLCSVWLQSFSMLIPGLRRCSASLSARKEDWSRQHGQRKCSFSSLFHSLRWSIQQPNVSGWITLKWQNK